MGAEGKSADELSDYNIIARDPATKLPCSQPCSLLFKSCSIRTYLMPENQEQEH